MKKFLLLAALLVIILPQASAQKYAPVGDKIKTQWAEKVNPENVWNVYPRPLMQRTQWKNLNGLWNYAILDKGKATPAKYDGDILVPFCVESSLSGVGKTIDKTKELWYKRTFTVPSSWNGSDVMLNFGAVDWRADVWVNGVKVGYHTGGYTPFGFNITQALVKGDNEIVVRVFDATTDSYQPCGKQNLQPQGIMYTAVSGIWQTVWIEPVAPKHISNLVIVPDVDNNTVSVDVAKSCPCNNFVTEVKVFDKGQVVASAKSLNDSKTEVNMPANVKLWSPDEPYLYDMEVSIISDGKVVDKVKSYVAMRKFSTKRDADGIVRLQLNNKNIFEFGLLDQGWWPDGLYTAPSYEAMIFDLDKTKAWGYNLIRKHVKVEPATWYTYCDKKGIIVWQDMPAGDYGHSQPWKYNDGYYNEYASSRTAESEANYYKEWKEIIDNFRSYPCISTWIPFNEAWGQFKTDEVVKWTKEYDPNHLINPASGGNFYDCGDILDLHHYPNPDMFFYEGNRANVLGEFGGIGFPVEGHLWAQSNKSWGYVKFEDSKAVTDKYVDVATQLIELAKKGFCAGIYTQTTDCETEVNGIMTYDRKVVKMQEDRFREINQKVVNCLNK
jgi:beta-galactosidase/beta-glucuronidase